MCCIAKVSLDRVNDFLQKVCIHVTAMSSIMLMRQPQTELLDEFSEQPSDIQAQLSAQPDTDVIGFRNASFSWANTTGGSTAPTPGSGRRNFNLRIDGDLFFKKGKINLIIGPTGCGKTSLLMALLDSAQESWVLDRTIRSNILFGAEYDEDRYNKGE